MCNTDNIRSAYDSLKNSALSNLPMQKHTLRVRRVLASDNNTYSFTLKPSAAGQINDQVLQENDGFVVTGIRVGVVKTHNTRNDQSVLFTYPDPNFFIGNNAGTGADEADSVMTVFNGKLSFETGTNTRLRDLLLSPNALCIPESPVFTPSAGQQQLPATGCGFGIIEMVPFVMLSGSQENTWTIRLGAGDYSKIAGGIGADGTTPLATHNELVIEMYGILVTGGAAAMAQTISTPVNCAI